MRKWVLLIATIVIIAAFAGCLGGGEEGKSGKPEYVTAKGTWETEGSVATEESTEPVLVTETVDIPIPEENVTALDIVIKVMEASGDYTDGNTKPDDVSGSLEIAGGGGSNETLKKGTTNYQTTISIKASEGQNLPSRWTLSLDVTCNPSDDNWPGPIIISVYPDHGFSYNVSVSYSYLTLPETY